MTEQLPGMEGERRKPELSQWYTPQQTARRIVEWALSPLATYANVLEPSAGRGHLANAIRDSARPVAIGSPFCVDIDPVNVASLQAQGFEALCRDFLSWEPEHFDIAIMNPPYENGAAEAHILHALKRCDRVVAHVPLTTLEGKKRREGLWSEAYLKRLAICSSRPKYGEKGGATAMCTIDVVRRPEYLSVLKNLDYVAASGVDVEWWA